MTRFLARSLAVLDRIFKIEGGQGSISQLELAAPLQPVADVGRLAQLRAVDTGFYGYFPQNQIQPHLGAGQINTILTPYVDLAKLTDPGGLTLWIMNINVTADSSIVTSVRVGMDTPVAVAEGWAPRSFYLMRVTSVEPFSDTLIYRYGGVSTYIERVPIPFPPGSTLNIRGDASGAGNISIAIEMYITPIGVLPPGMA